MRAVVSEAPCDVVFDLLADPHQHERIFEAIEVRRGGGGEEGRWEGREGACLHRSQAATGEAGGGAVRLMHVAT